MIDDPITPRYVRAHPVLVDNITWRARFAVPKHSTHQLLTS